MCVARNWAIVRLTERVLRLPVDPFNRVTDHQAAIYQDWNNVSYYSSSATDRSKRSTGLKIYSISHFTILQSGTNSIHIVLYLTVGARSRIRKKNLVIPASLFPILLDLSEYFFISEALSRRISK